MYRNIFGPINLEGARGQINSYSDAQEGDIDQLLLNIAESNNCGEKYDFLLSWSKPSAPCLNLASLEFSEQIDKGHMLWAVEQSYSYGEAEEVNTEAERIQNVFSFY